MKKFIAILMAIVMLAAMGVVASAANRPDFNSRTYVTEDGLVVFESADDFFEWYSIDSFIARTKALVKERLLEDEAAYEEAKAEYGISNIDALVEAIWADGGTEFLCDTLSDLLDMDVNPSNLRSDAVKREIYILGLNSFVDFEPDIADDATLAEIVDYIKFIYSEEEETTAPTTESTTEPTTEPTTAPEEETTVAEETTAPATEETTVAEETTTAAEETTTKKPGSSTSPETGDPSMLLTGAFALMGALGVVATGKRKK